MKMNSGKNKNNTNKKSMNLTKSILILFICLLAFGTSVLTAFAQTTPRNQSTPEDDLGMRRLLERTDQMQIEQIIDYLSGINPKNVIIILDVSGSMQHHNLYPMARNFVFKILDKAINDGDTVTFISFDSNVHKSPELTNVKINIQNRNKIKEAVPPKTSPDTRLGTSIRKAHYEALLILEDRPKNENKFLILVSDGYHNAVPKEQPEDRKEYEKFYVIGSNGEPDLSRYPQTKEADNYQKLLEKCTCQKGSNLIENFTLGGVRFIVDPATGKIKFINEPEIVNPNEPKLPTLLISKGNPEDLKKVVQFNLEFNRKDIDNAEKKEYSVLVTRKGNSKRQPPIPINIDGDDLKKQLSSKNFIFSELGTSGMSQQTVKFVFDLSKLKDPQGGFQLTLKDLNAPPSDIVENVIVKFDYKTKGIDINKYMLPLALVLLAILGFILYIVFTNKMEITIDQGDENTSSSFYLATGQKIQIGGLLPNSKGLLHYDISTDKHAAYVNRSFSKISISPVDTARTEILLNRGENPITVDTPIEDGAYIEISDKSGSNETRDQRFSMNIHINNRRRNIK